MVGVFGGTDDGRKLALLQALVVGLDGVHAVLDRPIQHVPDLGPGDVLGGAHGAGGAFLALALAFLAVQDVGLGDPGMAVLDQHLLDQVLDLFDGGYLAGSELIFEQRDYFRAQALGSEAVAPTTATAAR